MYKYESNEALIENMYLMLATFRQYNIIPIFVFDGKPPTEKKALLQKRREDKKEAENEYKILKEKLETNGLTEDDKHEIINNMESLKKQFIYITREKISIVKSLMRSYGATYYDAPGEADELCALLVMKNKAWVCLSEDMDMFVYGCPRVIRYFNLFNRTAVLYDTAGILENLRLTQKELREICVLSGTDYNIKSDKNSKNKPTLHETLQLFEKYKNDKTGLDFYEWLKTNSAYITDYELLKSIHEIFELKNTNLSIFEKIKIVNGPIDVENIKNILKTDGFVFPAF